ncbi:hypothetical protein PYCC9005_001788 [Savitreella phatthalungensis]
MARRSFASLRSVASKTTTLFGDDEAEPKFPTWDLLLLAAMRFAEPISFTSINPYLFFMIRHLGIGEKDIGFYAGIVQASFPLAEFATALFWGRLSDKLGRRPVILICLGGCIVPTLLFGFSHTVWEAVLWRTVTGLINGNAPVVATACAEIVTYKAHQALAMSVVPISWSVGSILGPVIGGALADPVGQHPELFPTGKIRDFFLNFPFALPNIVASILFAVALVFGVLFLKETKPDIGFSVMPNEIDDETTSLLSHTYSTRHANATRRGSVVSISTTQAYEPAILILPPTAEENGHLLQPPSSVRRTDRPRSSNVLPPAEPYQVKQTTFMEDARQFTFQIYLALFNFALLAFHTMAGDQVFPLYCSTSRAAGGLALDAKSVGLLFSLTSFGSLAMQFIFPYAHAVLGSRGCLQWSSVFGIVAYIMLPSLVYLPDGRWLFAGSFIAILFLRASAILGYPAITILLTNAVPPPTFRNPNSILGTVNGLSQSVGSFSRSLGALIMGAIFAWSLNVGAPMVSWAMCIVLALVVLVAARWQDEEGEGESAAARDAALDTVIEEDDDEEGEEESRQR